MIIFAGVLSSKFVVEEKAIISFYDPKSLCLLNYILIPVPVIVKLFALMLLVELMVNCLDC